MRKLLVFDIDETLVFTTTDKLEIPESFTIGSYFVYERPHVHDLMKTVSESYDLGLWSSGSEIYVKTVADHLKPRGQEFKVLFSKDQCTLQYDPQWGDYVNLKKLSKLEKFGYSLEHILMVEDIPRNIKQNYGNGIIVNHFRGEPDDELRLLKDYLVSIRDVENVRVLEKRDWREAVGGRR